MRFHDVMATRWWRKKMMSGAFVLLGLAGVGLPNSWAQSGNHGNVEPSGVSGEGAQAAYYNNRLLRSRTGQPTATPSPRQRPSPLSPDHDDFYFINSPARIVPTRSYYAAGNRDFLLPSPVAAPPLAVPAALPWNQGGFKDYDVLAELSQGPSRSVPRKYTLEAVTLAQGPPVAIPEAAVLVVHLPQNALFWVEGKPIRLRGPTTSLPSPPLRPGGRYSYTLAAAWIEDGHWVRQARDVSIQAGRIEAVFLRSR